MDIIIDILAFVFFEIIVWLMLWILALILWGFCLPLSIIIVTPYFLVLLMFKKMKDLNSNYAKVFDYWMDLGARLIP